MGPLVLCHSSQSCHKSLKTACGTAREGSVHDLPHLACIFGGIVAKYAVGPQLDMFLDLFRKRDPQAATTRPSFLDDPRLSLGDGPASASFHAYGSAITRHQSPLSTGDRSGVTGDTLGSEARPTGEEYESQASGDWRPLSSIPEGEEGDPPSPNATDGVRRGPGPSCPEASRVSKARLAC